MQIKKQPDTEQTGSKLGQEYIKAVFCHVTYLTYMQNTYIIRNTRLDDKLESRLLGEISPTSDRQMTPP